ncbi:hypothetical protein EE612_038134 [Oryza sativa]|nr:hypothetical protein EE612_038134 [Oryza sativa]
MTGARRHCRRVVMFPFPFRSHIAPMLQLAELLRGRGLAVTVVRTTFNAPDAARHPELIFVPIHERLPDAATDPGTDLVEQMLALNAACEAPFREALRRVVRVGGARWRARWSTGSGTGTRRSPPRRRSASPRSRSAPTTPPRSTACSATRASATPATSRSKAKPRRGVAAGRAAARARPDPRRRRRRGAGARVHRPRRQRHADGRDGLRDQHLPRHREAGAAEHPAPPAEDPGVRHRADAQAARRAGGARPARAGQRLRCVAARALAAVRAVREPRQRGAHRPRGVRRNGPWARRQWRPIPLGHPPRLRHRHRLRRPASD